MCAIDCGSFGSLTSCRTLASAADVSSGSLANAGLARNVFSSVFVCAQLREQSDGLVGQLLGRDVVERRLDLGERLVGALRDAGHVLRDAGRIEARDAIVRGRQQLVQIGERRLDVETMQPIDDLRSPH